MVGDTLMRYFKNTTTEEVFGFDQALDSDIAFMHKRINFDDNGVLIDPEWQEITGGWPLPSPPPPAPTKTDLIAEFNAKVEQLAALKAAIDGVA